MKKKLIKMVTLLSIGLVIAGSSLAAPADDFVIKVKTDNVGVTADAEFIIPINTMYNYNYNVDCNNDGVNEAIGQTSHYTCSYADVGTYTIRIKDNTGSGTGFPQIYFNNVGDKEKITEIIQWGTGKWGSMKNSFYGASNLKMNATDAPDLSITTSLESMFQNTTSLSASTGVWNWDTSHITSMAAVFFGATDFNGDIASWDVSNVLIMSSMFRETAFNRDISSWNVSEVEWMSLMFANNKEFNQDISGWAINPSNNLYMNGMFEGAIAFNQPLNNWNTSHVVNMKNMFEGAIAFNQPLNNWNTSMVEEMNSMFEGATNFDRNIGDWNVENVENFEDMFKDNQLYWINYDSLLRGWNSQNLKTDMNLNAGNSEYCAAVAHNNLTSADGYNWTISDGGLKDSCSPEITSNGGGNKAYISVPGGQTAVTTVSAIDPNGGEVTYGIDTDAGPDGSKFQINSSTGELTFINAPDFENPNDITDPAGDNEYVVTVTASDGVNSSYQDIYVTVTDPSNQAPVITSNGGGDTAAITVDENQSAVTDITSTDEDAEDDVTFDITGDDASKFSMSASGILTFSPSPDFENPTDVNTDNVYEVTVTVSDDAGASDSQDISVTVVNINEAPTDIALSNDDVDENQSGDTVGLFTTVDPDGNGSDQFYQADRGLGACDTPGADDEDFYINSANELRTSTAFDYETKNTYEICIRAVDNAGLFFDKNFTIHINDVDEKPEYTTQLGTTVTPFEITVQEGQTVITTVNATDPEGTAVTYSISDLGLVLNEDYAMVSVDAAGVVSFNTAPDFENPTDVNADNVYKFIIDAKDASNNVSMNILFVNIADIDESLSEGIFGHSRKKKKKHEEEEEHKKTCDLNGYDYDCDGDYDEDQGYAQDNDDTSNNGDDISKIKERLIREIKILKLKIEILKIQIQIQKYIMSGANSSKAGFAVGGFSGT